MLDCSNTYSSIIGKRDKAGTQHSLGWGWEKKEKNLIKGVKMLSFFSFSWERNR